MYAKVGESTSTAKDIVFGVGDQLFDLHLRQHLRWKNGSMQLRTFKNVVDVFMGGFFETKRSSEA